MITPMVQAIGKPPQWLRVVGLMAAAGAVFAGFIGFDGDTPDTSWRQDSLTVLPHTVGMCTVTGVLMAVVLRSRGDRMPPALWAQRRSTSPAPPPAAPLPPATRQRPPARDAAEVEHSVPTAHRLGMAAFFVVMAAAAPVFAVKALTDGAGPTLFVLAWLAIMGLLARQATRLTRALRLDGEVVRITTMAGAETEIPTTSIRAIRWPSAGHYVALTHDAGTTWLHRRTSGLPDLMVELRRRNPAITYDGLWPPPTGGRWNFNPWR
jgi:hypothetical protein